MTLKMPVPGTAFDRNIAIRGNATLETEDLRNRKKGSDVELTAERLIIRSPNGSRWQITVSNTGTLSAVAL